MALFLNTADDPVIERILTPRLALTVAEHLAFDDGRHVLVVMADMTSYCEAVRQVGAARGEVPGRRGYPGYLYSDLASLYERCGRVRGRPGSVTEVPVLTMPAGDITHPVPDLTGYITEGQVVLSSERNARGLYPPIEPLSSLSRLMRRGAGPGRTRDDHLDLAAQALSLLARARDVAELADLLGAEALSETERRYLAFADAFDTGLAQRSDEDRDLDDTLDRVWRAVSVLPRRELDHAAGRRARPPLPAARRSRGGPGCQVDRLRVEPGGSGWPTGSTWPSVPSTSSTTNSDSCVASSDDSPPWPTGQPDVWQILATEADTLQRPRPGGRWARRLASNRGASRRRPGRARPGRPRRGSPTRRRRRPTCRHRHHWAATSALASRGRRLPAGRRRRRPARRCLGRADEGDGRAGRDRPPPSRHPRPLAASPPNPARGTRPATWTSPSAKRSPVCAGPSNAKPPEWRTSVSYRRILVAVDDSPAGLDAARVAVELAAGWGGEVRAGHGLARSCPRRCHRRSSHRHRPARRCRRPLGAQLGGRAGRGPGRRPRHRRARRRTLPSDPGRGRGLGGGAHRHGPLRSARTRPPPTSAARPPMSSSSASGRCSSSLEPRSVRSQARRHDQRPDRGR